MDENQTIYAALMAIDENTNRIALALERLAEMFEEATSTYSPDYPNAPITRYIRTV